MDIRAEAQAASLAQRVSPESFYMHTGTYLDSSHALFKALWIKTEEPDIFAQTKKLLPPGSFVVQEAAGVAMVDYSNASSLALLDHRTRRWSDEVLGAVGLDPRMLPELVPGTHGVGRVTEAFAAATGLTPDACVVVGCGDEMAATLGAGVFAPGEVCDVVGTAEPVCAGSSAPREDRTMLVECHPHGDPDSWLLENPGFVSGGNLRWWRDQLCSIDDPYDDITAPAAGVAPGAEGDR